MTFIDDLLAEAEVRDSKERIEMSKLRADQTLAALAVLESQVDEVNQLADDEIALVEQYREAEIQKLRKKMSWLEYNLEQFMRASESKTLNLPHGRVTLRLGRDKIEITNPELFLPVAERKGLMKLIPESTEPDLAKVQAYLKRGLSLPGVAITPAQIRFSYKTLKGQANGKTATTEAGIDSESDDQAQAAA
jgi:phage host-nuclease inhibitor protein Gam